MMRAYVWLRVVVGGLAVACSDTGLKERGMIGVGGEVIVFERYTQGKEGPEECADDYLLLRQPGRPDTTLCWAMEPRGFTAGQSHFIVADKIGGNGGGWRLYRYNLATGLVDFFDASEIDRVDVRADSEGLFLERKYLWRWLNDEPSATRISEM